MPPRIYTSNFPDVPIGSTSIFTHVLGSESRGGDISGFPGSELAFIDAATGASLTRARLRELSLSFGFGIRDHPRISAFSRRGDTVLIYSPNSLAWPVVLLGCVSAGLRCTLANNAYVSRELAHQYMDSGATLIFTAEEGITTVREMFAELGIPKDEGDAWTIVLARDLQWAGGPQAALTPACVGLLTLDDLLARGTLAHEEKFDGELADETTYLCYSSGTTGKPKVRSISLVLIRDLNTQMICDIVGRRGAFLLIHLPLTMGWPVLIQSQFEPVQFCSTIERFKVSFALVVPPVLVVLARHPAVEKYDLSSLEYMLSAAAPLGADLVKQVKTRLLARRSSGATCVISQGYGLTETTTGTNFLLLKDADRKVGSIGTLVANMEARIIHDEDGNVDSEKGEPGELWVRSKTVMKGYLNNPQATKDSITPDGWFKTGDIVFRDDEGDSKIVLSVPPAELESVLLTHPDIADAAVIGVDSAEQATELPRAYIVHARPKELHTEEDRASFATGVAKWMESKVARHKLLRGGIRLIDLVPKSAAGKILRRELRGLAKQEVAGGEIDTKF
ncbi:AMP binding protein, partial [Mycena galericulata]